MHCLTEAKVITSWLRVFLFLENTKFWRHNAFRQFVVGCYGLHSTWFCVGCNIIMSWHGFMIKHWSKQTFVIVPLFHFIMSTLCWVEDWKLTVFLICYTSDIELWSCHFLLTVSGIYMVCSRCNVFCRNGCIQLVWGHRLNAFKCVVVTNQGPGTRLKLRNIFLCAVCVGVQSVLRVGHHSPLSSHTGERESCTGLLLAVSLGLLLCKTVPGPQN